MWGDGSCLVLWKVSDALALGGVGPRGLRKGLSRVPSSSRPARRSSCCIFARQGHRRCLYPHGPGTSPVRRPGPRPTGCVSARQGYRRCLYPCGLGTARVGGMEPPGGRFAGWVVGCGSGSLFSSCPARWLVQPGAGSTPHDIVNVIIRLWSPRVGQVSARQGTHLPAQDPAPAHIGDEGNADPADLRAHVGDVGDPQLVEATGDETAVDQIRRTRVPGRRRGFEDLIGAAQLSVLCFQLADMSRLIADRAALIAPALLHSAPRCATPVGGPLARPPIRVKAPRRVNVSARTPTTNCIARSRSSVGHFL